MKFFNFFKNNRYNFLSLVAFCCLSLLPDLAMATTMPYDSALTSLKNSLTGPVAQAIAVIGIVASGATLIFGGEISGFLKSVIYLILVCSLLIAGNKIISVFGGSSTTATVAEIAYINNINKVIFEETSKCFNFINCDELI